MTLQFQGYGDPFARQKLDQEQRQQRLQSMQQVVGQIGQGIGGFAGIQDQQKADRMNQILTALKFKEQGIDPSGAMSWVDTGKFPQASVSSSPMPNLMPSFSPQGQVASAGMPDTGYGEARVASSSPIIDAWNNHPNVSQFAPRQAPAQTPTQGFASLFQSKPVDYSSVMDSAGKGDYSPMFNLPPKEQANAMKAYEYNQNRADRESRDKQLTAYQQASLDAQKNRVTATVGEKQDQMDQKRWDAIVKDTDPYKASSRSPLGMATIGNLKADHVLPILKNPNSTNQDINASLAALDTVFQGGAATQSGIHSQEYDTLQSRLANIKTLLTSQPQAVATPEIKQHIIGLLNGLKQVNSALIKDQFDYVETAQPELIQKRQAAWTALRKRIEGGSTSGNSGITSSTQYQKTATNPKTGEKMGFDGTKWVPIQ